MFDLILENFSSLRLNTELLEACGWDEEEVARVLALTQEAIQQLDDSIPPTPDSLEKLLENKLEPTATSSQIFIIKQIVFAEFKKAINDFSSVANTVEN